jgi:DNA-binding Lrp family transcriptional regulator
MKLDEFDFKLLNALIEMPEEKFKVLAQKLQTTLPTIYNRIDKLKKIHYFL